jgi:hypothetical protein
MMQNDCMSNDAAVTMRLPTLLKKRLEARARQEHRSLSAQMLHDLDLAAAASAAVPRRGRFLGLYADTPVPTDAEILEVRARLWGRLAAARHA